MPETTALIPAASAATSHEAGELTPHDARVAALALKELLWQDPTPEYLEQRAEALQLARQSGDEALYAEMLLFGIATLYRMHRGDEAKAAFSQAKAIFEHLQDTMGLALWRATYSYVHKFRGDLVQQIALLRDALPQLEHHPDPRYRVRALDALANTLNDTGLHDAAQELFAQQLAAAQACQPPAERYYRRAVLSSLEVRFLKLLRRFGGRYALPTEDTEVQALLQDTAAAQKLFSEESEGVDKYLAQVNYVQYLIQAGHYAQAQAVWAQQPQAWKQAPPEPLLAAFTQAELAIFCEHSYARAIAILQPFLVDYKGPNPAADLYLHAILAKAHYKAGDYKAACQAQRQFYQRSMRLASNNTQTQAALLGLELKAEREKLLSQQALVHAGKLVAVGQLASSLAHEINQPAATLLLLARQLQNDLQSERWTDLAEGIEDVQLHTDRLSQLVMRLKNFARDEPVHLQLLSLSAVLQQAHSLVQPRLKVERVQYHVEVPAGLHVRADQERLCLALVNLINNALDALAEQTTPAPEIRLSARADQAAGEVHLYLRDNGPGLTEAVQAHLFEPFHTTKPAGQGLGLGLTITREALMAMDGRIALANAPEGRGAQATLVLKAALRLMNNF
jgi:signal transduction histidine kinase